MAASSPPEEPTVKKYGFLVKNGVISCNGYERVDSGRLAKLFHPEVAGATPRTHKKYADEAKKLFSRPFFAAQLHFYGITFPRNSTEAQLGSLLDKAVGASQCNHVPPALEALHSDMINAYEKEVDAWKKATQSWETEWKLRQDEQWAQLETPAERAAFDLARFMEHYFLTDGVPDPAKKPEPLALYNLTDDQVIASLRETASQVPGLEIASAGSGPDHAVCIGWERASVFSLAGEIENLAREKQKERVETEWKKALQNHRQFVVEAASSPTAPVSRGEGEADRQTHLRLARGSFVLQSKTVTDQYHDRLKVTLLSLDIADSPTTTSDTLRAAVDLGVFQGTAILASSLPVLDWFVKRYDKTTLEAAVSVYGKSGQSKRKLDVQPYEDERPSKQRKTEECKPGRLFLRMRGRKVIDNHICANIQHGYLDFSDGAWTKFKGVLDIPGVGEDIEVEGFRVAQQPAVEPPPWNTYWPLVRDETEAP